MDAYNDRSIYDQATGYRPINPGGPERNVGRLGLTSPTIWTESQDSNSFIETLLIDSVIR